ncbi:MAG: tyrosine-type recombinase/integrase [bacterium]
MLYKQGNICWCDFTFDGKRRRYSCRTKDKKVAEEVENAIRGEVVRGKFDLPQKYKSNPIFGEIFQNYINNQSPGKNKDLKICSSKHFLPVFKDKNISDTTTGDIKNYQLQRKLEILSLPKNTGKKESEISFRMANAEIITLSHFFNYCIENDYIDKKNPASKIKKLNELKRLKTLSDSDIEKLIAGATNKITRDIITFLIYTGSRKGEALNLKWDDVDLQNGVIAIKGTKTKYDRYIPISDALKAILDGIEKNQDSFYMSLSETG